MNLLINSAFEALVGLACVLGTLQLHFEAFHSNLEPVHRLDCRRSARSVVIAHETCGKREKFIFTQQLRIFPQSFKQLTETLALVRGAIDVHLGAEDGSEREEHLRQLVVAELLRQVVDEEVAALRSYRND